MTLLVLHQVAPPTFYNKIAPMVSTYMVCKIQNFKIGTVPTVYPADSKKGFCEVCNNAIIAKYCELKRHNWWQSTQITVA